MVLEAVKSSTLPDRIAINEREEKSTFTECGQWYQMLRLDKRRCVSVLDPSNRFGKGFFVSTLTNYIFGNCSVISIMIGSRSSWTGITGQYSDVNGVSQNGYHLLDVRSYHCWYKQTNEDRL